MKDDPTYILVIGALCAIGVGLAIWMGRPEKTDWTVGKAMDFLRQNASNAQFFPDLIIEKPQGCPTRIWRDAVTYEAVRRYDEGFFRRHRERVRATVRTKLIEDPQWSPEEIAAIMATAGVVDRPELGMFTRLDDRRRFEYFDAYLGPVMVWPTSPADRSYHHAANPDSFHPPMPWQHGINAPRFAKPGFLLSW